MSRSLVLITGASSGIGLAFARAYASHGWDVALTARRADRLEKLAEEIRLRFGVEAHALTADLAEANAPEELQKNILALGRNVDGLVNNAGYGQPGGFVVESKEGSFYFAGDTALTLDMKLIAEEFQLRFAVLPVGDNFTMGATDAAKAAGLVGCDDVIGVHYDTWPPIAQNAAAWAARVKAETSSEPIVIRPGEKITL